MTDRKPTQTTTTRKEQHTNTVEYLGGYGGDESHAQSAWTSTSRDLDIPDSKGITKRQRMGKVLKMLAENEHHTPFEKSSLHFLLTTDIATHIQFLKHRVGVSINGESARYKELKDDKYYVPQDWPESEVSLYCEHLEDSLKKYHECLVRLVTGGMDRKRAKESARMYLPYGNQITMDVMFNFRSLMHFAGLRYSVHAQKEIRDMAQTILEKVASLPEFRLSLQAFNLIDEDGKLKEPFTDKG